MANKCEFCKEKMFEDEMGKIAGTIIKIKNEDKKNEKKYVCRECRKEGKEKGLLKEKKK